MGKEGISPPSQSYIVDYSSHKPLVAPAGPRILGVLIPKVFCRAFLARPLAGGRCSCFWPPAAKHAPTVQGNPTPGIFSVSLLLLRALSLSSFTAFGYNFTALLSYTVRQLEGINRFSDLCKRTHFVCPNRCCLITFYAFSLSLSLLKKVLIILFAVSA